MQNYLHNDIEDSFFDNYYEELISERENEITRKALLSNRVLKGSTYMDAGYIYAPYIPMTTTPLTVTPNIVARYKTKCVMEKYYGRLIL